jgi:hypothetical protein
MMQVTDGLGATHEAVAAIVLQPQRLLFNNHPGQR